MAGFLLHKPKLRNLEQGDHHFILWFAPVISNRKIPPGIPLSWAPSLFVLPQPIPFGFDPEPCGDRAVLYV